MTKRVSFYLQKRCLNPTELQVVLLHTIGGVKLKDIAKALNKNAATVRWKYQWAIKKMKKALEREE